VQKLLGGNMKTLKILGICSTFVWIGLLFFFSNIALVLTNAGEFAIFNLPFADLRTRVPNSSIHFTVILLAVWTVIAGSLWIIWLFASKKRA